MAFIMPHYVTANLIFSLWWLLATTPVWATFSVESAEVYRVEQGYLIDAEFLYPLSPAVEEALTQGITITFVSTIKISQPAQWLSFNMPWKTLRWQTSLRYEVRYHALSQQFILRDRTHLDQRTFPTLLATLNYMGNLDSFLLPLKPTEDLSALTVQLQSTIDVHALPAPLQPSAFLSRKWHLTSPWVTAVWL